MADAVPEGFSDFAIDAWPALLRSARLLTGEHHLAEDLCQAVLLKLYLRWSQADRWNSKPAYA